MTQANDSVTLPPSTGVIATHLVAGKEYQVTMPADVSGHIIGTKPIYFYQIPSQVHVNAANTVHWDLFNAHASLLVRILTIRQQPDIVAAVTGVAFAWLLERTTAVGTGGTALTAWLPNTTQAALDAAITARSKPTGGATAGIDLWNYQIHSEETNAATIQLANQGGLELVPQPLAIVGALRGIELRQNEGLRVVQVTASLQGNTGWLVGFSVE